jgi:thiol-disulfide isomerase/thioredoxin
MIAALPVHRALMALAVVCLAPLTGCGDDARPEPVPAPLPLGVTLDGDTLSTADFRGKVLLAYLWTTWCAPCKVGFAQLDSVVALVSAEEQLAVVAVGMDSDVADLHDYLEDQDVRVTVTTGYCCVTSEDFSLRGIPAYEILDPEGRKKQRFVGYRAPDVIAAAVHAELDAAARGGGAPGRFE